MVLRFLVVNAVVTSVALGAFKVNGVVKLQPDKLENENARYAFEKLVYAGEVAYVQGRDLVDKLRKAAS
eukprot:CAMPEP_0202892078 /NCGR_PEP_ID=MMETSP1392-20130828/1918_1 /ASSEMBLY_ACC=CAM_ASM_000868 /TAXON_ID=225041 /ORGANISM="Chlamydomonas chlamydogama, Strain SAG 11-48b" /LENGTH=68 /DNA_ID=CAMNT_0049575957 /DNA_START=69 /DNA_END=275 /DNA_ORIENTATION=+